MLKLEDYMDLFHDGIFGSTREFKHACMISRRRRVVFSPLISMLAGYVLVRALLDQSSSRMFLRVFVYFWTHSRKGSNSVQFSSTRSCSHRSRLLGTSMSNMSAKAGAHWARTDRKNAQLQLRNRNLPTDGLLLGWRG